MRSCSAVIGLAMLAACTAKDARRPDTSSPATATLSGNPASAVDAAAVKQAVRATDDAFVAAALKSDTVGMAAQYTDDAMVLPPNMKAAQGRAAIASLYSGMVTAEKPTAFAITSQDIIAVGDYAIETGTYELTAQLKNGKSSHDVGKFIEVLKKQPDGSYKMLRDMFSSDLPVK